MDRIDRLNSATTLADLDDTGTLAEIVAHLLSEGGGPAASELALAWHLNHCRIVGVEPVIPDPF